MSRSSRGALPRGPSYPTYNPPPRPAGLSTYDSYEAEKNKSFKYVSVMDVRSTLEADW